VVKNRKTEKTEKTEGRAKKTKKQEKRTERSTERRRGAWLKKKKEVCRTAGSVLAWRKRRKTPPLCSTTQGTNARDTGKR